MMHQNRFNIVLMIILTLAVSGFTGCGSPSDTAVDTPVTDVLILGAYTVPKEVYQKEIIPAFMAHWKAKTGHEVKVEQSYVGSGAQSRAIAGGFEADVAALSLEGDITRLAQEGLITHDWKTGRYGGFVSRSVVVIGYREGNPKNIQGWEDLERGDIEILCANPKTSGGAQWFVNAIYGASLKKSELAGGRDLGGAELALKNVARRIKVMDKSARASMTTYEQGIGDVILTYENEALLRKIHGANFPYLVPDATMLIENPVAVVDQYAEKHGVRELAEEFVAFLCTDEVQRMYARYGLRPVSSDIAGEFISVYPQPAHLFDIQYLGGWQTVDREIFGDEGVWTRVNHSLSQEQVNG